MVAVSTAVLTHQWPIQIAAWLTVVAPTSAIVILCVCGVDISRAMVRALLGILSISVILNDYNVRCLGSRPVWPVFVLLADLSLVIGLGRWFATGLIAVATLWVVVATLEQLYRFGLFDLPGSAPDWYRWELARDHVRCTDPPCTFQVNKSIIEASASLVVLLVDFAATRSFADTAEKEQAAMAHTIKTVEAIAKLLAGYDVDTVAEMLQEAEAEGRLPAAMHEALHRLEQNLRAYRPYLPKSCLPAQDCDNDAQDVMSQLSLSGRSSSSHTAGTGEDIQDVHGAAKLLGALKTVRATMVVVNTRNALPCLGQDPHTFTSFFNMLLTNTMSAVESRRGLVDMFIGDRILASFNTSRPCLVHGTAAVGAVQDVVRAVRSNATRRVSNTECDSGAGACAAQNIVKPLSNENNDGNSEGPLRVNIGAASGRVLCGDTGCLEMRRFSLLGVLPLMACGMERAARAARQLPTPLHPTPPSSALLISVRRIRRRHGSCVRVTHTRHDNAVAATDVYFSCSSISFFMAVLRVAVSRLQVRSVTLARMIS
eukprot:TRINITY_DN2991_c1_g1_i7.p1 TRINITY_DN2991_c1_g1~~TRINITY_DN2991_c1_g1_i7.p1  ORF type:complete len:614 (+),score=144.25 TRINITY_DN2991_c1_g1_i7:217-1842(+)